MKVAILTQPLGNNYGGILQNYALQEILRKLGHDPFTLDAAVPEYKVPVIDRGIRFFWRLAKKIKGDKSFVSADVVKNHRLYVEPGNKQKSFFKKYMSVISMPQQITFKNVQDLFFDAYVVGSDQVWRPRFSPFLPNYYLDFVEDEALRIAYAASFGVDAWEYSAEQQEMATELLEKFSAISVREYSALTLCKNKLGRKAELVLDPTLLLQKEDYLKLIEKEEHRDEVAIYVLDRTKETECEIKSICDSLHLKPRYIGCPNKSGFPSVEEWLSDIFYSEYVITDSFHGTVFSIIAHKNFSVIPNLGRGKDRFYTLLKNLGLDSRMVDSSDADQTDSSIDYLKVDKILAEMRLRSVDFLQKALEKHV